MEKIERVNQKLDWQVVEGITFIRYQTLDKVTISLSKGADQAGKAEQKSAIFPASGMLHILRCIALAQWKFQVSVHQGLCHCSGDYRAVGWAWCDGGGYVEEEYIAVVPACLTRWCSSLAGTG